MAVKFSNNAVSTLSAGISNSATSLSVASASSFPTLGASDYTYVTLAEASNSSAFEIVKVTAISGTTFTIVRAQQSTTARAFSSGDKVELRVTAALLEEAIDEADYTVTQSDVTAHQSALSITESQISDLQSYLTSESNNLSASVTWANVPDANITQSAVTQHQAAISITESQISDLGSYLPSASYTAADVLTKIKTVDGSGSGLDADLLDGRTSTEFALLTGASFTGDVSISSGTAGDAVLTISSDTDNNDESDHPSIRLQQDGGAIDYRIGLDYRDDAGGTGRTTNNGNNGLVFTDIQSWGGGIWYSPDNGANVHKMWHAGNDGASSGLDADQLDGQHGSHYLDYNNFTNTPTVPTNNNQLTNGAGYITSYTVTESDVTGHQAALSITESQISDLGTYIESGDTVAALTITSADVNGGSIDGATIGANSAAAGSFTTVTASGDITAYSDARLKTDIQTLDGSAVLKMRGVEFIKNGRLSSGVIAQELEQVAPELVFDDGQFKSVAYGNLVGYLIEAIKDLKKEIEALKEEH